MTRLAWGGGCNLGNHAAFGPREQGQVRGPGAGTPAGRMGALAVLSDSDTGSLVESAEIGPAVHCFFCVSFYEERARTQDLALLC